MKPDQLSSDAAPCAGWRVHGAMNLERFRGPKARAVSKLKHVNIAQIDGIGHPVNGPALHPDAVCRGILA